jgi:hypothetical protein
VASVHRIFLFSKSPQPDHMCSVAIYALNLPTCQLAHARQALSVCVCVYGRVICASMWMGKGYMWLQQFWFWSPKDGGNAPRHKLGWVLLFHTTLSYLEYPFHYSWPALFFFPTSFWTLQVREKPVPFNQGFYILSFVLSSTLPNIIYYMEV